MRSPPFFCPATPFPCGSRGGIPRALSSPYEVHNENHKIIRRKETTSLLQMTAACDNVWALENRSPEPSRTAHAAVSFSSPEGVCEQTYGPLPEKNRLF
jgi:hypothetical protein